MRFSDMVKEQGHGSFAAQVESTLPQAGVPDTAESRRELTVDNLELKAQVKAALNSVNAAIARLLPDAGKPGNANRITQYETVRSQLMNVESALEQPGSFAMGVVSSMEAAISTLSFEEDSSSNADAPGNGVIVTPAMAANNQQLFDKHVQEDEFMLSLGARNMQLYNAGTSHAALEAHAASSVTDAQTDLNIAVALAAMMYDPSQSKSQVEDYLADARTSMLAAAETSPAYIGALPEAVSNAVDARIDLIRQQSEKIAAATHNGQDATTESLKNAAVAIVDLHAHGLRVRSDAHFAAVETCLDGCMSRDGAEALKAHKAAWNEQRHKTHMEIKGRLAAAHSHGTAQADGNVLPKDAQRYLEGLLLDSGINTILAEGAEQRQTDIGLLRAHGDAIHNLHREAIRAQKDLRALLKGKSADRMDTVAHSLGVSEHGLKSHVEAFRLANLNGMITQINASLHDDHSQSQGMQRFKS